MTTDKQLLEMARSIAAAREQWLSYWMKKVVPPVCARWISERKNIDAVARYLERKNICVVQVQGSNTERLMHGNEIISTFHVKFTHKAI